MYFYCATLTGVFDYNKISYNGNVGRYYHGIVVNETIIYIIKRFVVEGE